MSVYPKQRCDSWAVDLTQEQQWDVYAKFRRWNWKRVCDYIRNEYKVDPPSRSRLYAWRKQMAEEESNHRIENAIIAQAETGKLAAARNITDPKLIDAWKTLAAEQALDGNIDRAVKYTDMALKLAAQMTKRREMELKAAAQQTKDEQLQLAREKFEASEARLKALEEVTGDTKLTDAEKTAKYKDIFGM